MPGRAFGDRVFRWLLHLYPRAFRERYGDDLLAYHRQDAANRNYGTGPLRPLRRWRATLADLLRTVIDQRRPRPALPPSPRTSSMNLGRDLKTAWRSLWAAPGVTLSAMLVLTLGVGASTAIFSVVDAVILRGLPFPADRDLVSIAELYRGRPNPTTSQTFFDWQQRQTSFAGLAATVEDGAVATRDESPEFLRAVRVTVNLLDVLQVPPALGRPLIESDTRPGVDPVGLISDALWRRRFGGDPTVIGRVLDTRSGPIRIVGVMPPAFAYPLPAPLVGAVELWLPIVATADLIDRGAGGRAYAYTAIARLKPGVRVTDAAAQMSRLQDALAAAYPDWYVDRGLVVRSLETALVGPSVRSWMWLLLGAVLLVLVMSCLNAANLVVARAVGRAPEFAVRAALGASRWDLARALLVESVVLASLGAAGGLLLAYWGVDVLRAALPNTVPRLAMIALDLRVMTIAIGAALASGVLFGTMPALQASRPDLVAALREGSRGHSGGRGAARFRMALVVGEVALAVVLLAGGGLFLSSFVRVTTIDLGFDPRHVIALLSSQISSNGGNPPSANRRPAVAAGHATTEAIAARLRGVPGVSAVAVMQGGSPLEGSSASVDVQRLDDARTVFTRDDAIVVRAGSPELLTVLRGTLVGGRWIAAGDTDGADPVIVLNDEAAGRYFGADDPIGRRVLVDGHAHTIVGIFRAMRWRGPESPARPEGFVPFAQSSYSTGQLLVRTTGDAAALTPSLTAAIRAERPQAVLGPGSVTPLERSYADLLGQRTFNTIILVVFAVAGVAIAAVGVYGLLSFLVEQRRPEIGVRVALGAARSGIVSLVLSSAFTLLVAGLVPGLGAAWLLERTTRAFLFDATPHDPLLYLAVAGVLLATGLVAAFGPARRATRVDALATLRK